MDLNNITKSELDKLVAEAHELFKNELIKSESGKLASPGTGQVPNMKKGEEGSATPEGKTAAEGSKTGGVKATSMEKAEETPEGKSAAESSASASSGSPASPGSPSAGSAASPGACPTCGKGGAPDAGPSADPSNAKGDTGMAPDAGQPGPGADPAADQSMSPEQIAAEYAKLDPQSLEAHMMALKQVVEAKMAQSAGPAAGGAPAMGAPAPQGPGPGMLKSEAVNKELEELKKSVAALEAKNAELQHNVETSIGLFEKLTQPMRKSLTGLNARPATVQTKTPTKSEVKELMRPVVEAGKLNKHEQDTYMGYLMSDEISYDQIKHLIPKKQ